MSPALVSQKFWRFDLSALQQPLFWLALALWLVNDHLLKGAGLVPNWLTGKLSDIAFLVVMPVALATALPLSLRGREALALVLAGGAIFGINASQAVSDGVVVAASRLGLHWRLWCDATDLFTLPSLLLGWHLMSKPVAQSQRPWLQTMGLAVSSFAFMATSPPPSYVHTPFGVNGTSSPVVVTLRHVVSSIDCVAPLADVVATLTARDLDRPHALMLGPDVVFALDRAALGDESPAGACRLNTALTDYGRSSGDGCVMAILEAPDGEAVAMRAAHFWHESTGANISPDKPQGTCRIAGGISLGSGGIALVRLSGKYSWRWGKKIETQAVALADLLARAENGPGCGAAYEDYRQAWEETRACSVDEDCYVKPRLDIQPSAWGRSEDATCYAFVNSGYDAAISEIGRRFDALHCKRAPGHCGQKEFAICQQGLCTEPCPGVFLPTCLPKCPQAQVSGGACSVASPPCEAPSGDHCTCDSVTSKLTCRTNSFEPACPLKCMPPKPMQPQTSDAGVLDAGAVDAGGGDAGAAEVGAAG